MSLADSIVIESSLLSANDSTWLGGVSFERKAPVESRICTRPETIPSNTASVSSLRTLMCLMRSNCPSPVPVAPNLLTNVPSVVNFEILFSQ
ncbi:hypothetical protein D3C73_1251410 [compost metagenome]